MKKAIFFLTLFFPLLVSAEEKESKLFRALGYAMFVSKGTDLLSTEYGISAGGYEVNPLMEHRPVRVASSIAAPIFVNWWTARMYPENPKLALLSRAIVVSLWSYATLHNLRNLRGVK